MKADTVLTHYIYALHDPIVDVIGYVGRSTAPKERYKAHFNTISRYIADGRERHQSRHKVVTADKDLWLIYMIARKCVPRQMILAQHDNITLGEADAAENKWIDFMLAEDEPITNYMVQKMARRDLTKCPYEPLVSHLRTHDGNFDFRPVIEEHWGSMQQWEKSHDVLLEMVRGKRN